MLETCMKLCEADTYFQGIFFCPINWGNGPKMGQKQDFFNLLKNLVNDFY